MVDPPGNQRQRQGGRHRRGEISFELILLSGLVALGTVLGLQTLAADTGEGALTSACRLLQKVGLGAGGCGGGGDDDGAHADPDPRVDTDLALNREAHNAEEDIVVVREPDDRFAPRPPQMTSRHGLDEIIAAEQDARFRERFGVDLDLSEADLATLVGADPALFGRDEEVAGIQVAQAVPSTVVPGAPLAEPVVPEFRPANPNTTGIRPGAAANLNRPPTMAPSALLRALRLTPMTALTLLHGSSGPFSRRLEHPDFEDVWFRLSESDGGYRLSAHQCRESGILRCTLPKRLGEVELYPLQDVLPPADFEVLGLPQAAFIDPNSLQVVDLTHARSMTEWDFHFHPETLFEGFTEPRASREGERVYVFVDPNRYEVHFDPDTWTVVIRDKETGAEVPESEVTGGWLAPDGSVWSSREGGVRLDGGPGADVVVADGAATMSAGDSGGGDPALDPAQNDGEDDSERAADRAELLLELSQSDWDLDESSRRLLADLADDGVTHVAVVATTAVGRHQFVAPLDELEHWFEVARELTNHLSDIRLSPMLPTPGLTLGEDGAVEGRIEEPLELLYESDRSQLFSVVLPDGTPTVMIVRRDGSDLAFLSHLDPASSELTGLTGAEYLGSIEAQLNGDAVTGHLMRRVFGVNVASARTQSPPFIIGPLHDAALLQIFERLAAEGKILDSLSPNDIMLTPDGVVILDNDLIDVEATFGPLLKQVKVSEGDDSLLERFYAQQLNTVIEWIDEAREHQLLVLAASLGAPGAGEERLASPWDRYLDEARVEIGMSNEDIFAITETTEPSSRVGERVDVWEIPGTGYVVKRAKNDSSLQSRADANHVLAAGLGPDGRHETIRYHDRDGTEIVVQVRIRVVPEYAIFDGNLILQREVSGTPITEFAGEGQIRPILEEISREFSGRLGTRMVDFGFDNNMRFHEEEDGTITIDWFDPLRPRYPQVMR